jgi:myo-inositol-1(or 4)-monophosphatase
VQILKELEKQGGHIMEIQTMKNAAQKAGYFIKKKINGLNISIEEKERKEGVSDFVTEVDRQADAIIRDSLEKDDPSSGIVTEENGGKETERYFLVDPIDGTTNLISGIDYFAVSIAYIEKEIFKAGVIYDPIRNHLFWGEKDAGAFLNGNRIKVGKFPLNRMIFVQEENFGGTRQREILRRTALLSKGIAGLRKTGSTALDVANLASGKPWFIIATNLKSWDFAAAALIAQEADVIVTDLQGDTLSIKSDSLVAAEKSVYKKIMENLCV